VKKIVVGVLMLGGLALTDGPGNAQTFQNGPYYANPSWDQQIPAAQRFIVLANWNNEAVLDRETGLVWQRNPSLSENSWSNALAECYEGIFGNRRGWRLPSLAELSSLLDPTQTNPALPPGHPFQGIKFGLNDFYYTATAIAGEPNSVYAVTFNNANSTFTPSKTSDGNLWCVRGGGGAQSPQ
jgi:hypothetical protein